MMIFGFLRQNLKTKAVAVAFSIAWLAAGVEPQAEDAQARDRLAGFRQELYWCFTARADAVLCADGPVRTLAGLSLAPEHRRGHQPGPARVPRAWLSLRGWLSAYGRQTWRGTSLRTSAMT
jgi:hypothetical protein